MKHEHQRTQFLMSRDNYESGLKDLLEDVALELEWYDSNYLKTVYLPQNVAGSKRISVHEWLNSREEKRNGGSAQTSGK